MAYNVRFHPDTAVLTRGATVSQVAAGRDCTNPNAQHSSIHALIRSDPPERVAIGATQPSAQ
jgi:hypothetical protein